MPELPEVEFAAGQLRRWMEGRKILQATAGKTRIIRGSSPKAFAEHLTGRKLTLVERHGKYLMLHFDHNEGLVGHLGMTGKFVRRPKGAEEKFSRASFELEDGHTVHYRDPRMFGRLTLCPGDKLHQRKEIAQLGPDLKNTRATAELLAERLKKTSRAIKVALMDQTVVAGLGNIHAAEALFRAGINPRKAGGKLSKEQRAALSRAISEAIAYALKEQGADSDEISYVEEPGTANPFLVYGRKGEPCRRCKAAIKAITQGGRTTFFCPKCQR